MNTRALVLILCAALAPAAAAAQDHSHWGVAVSLNPTWKVNDKFKVLFDADKGVDIRSQDFSIGIARGRSQGGDWSVSYLHKNFKEGSFADGTETQCDQFVPGCFIEGKLRTLHHTTLSGIMAVKFIRIASIKHRVQIGMNLGGGIGALKGDVEQTDYDVATTCNNRGQCTGRQTQSVSTVDARTDLYVLPKYVLGKVEAAVGVVVAPGLKVRVAGGLDFPGTSSFNISSVYLIGAK